MILSINHSKHKFWVTTHVPQHCAINLNISFTFGMEGKTNALYKLLTECNISTLVSCNVDDYGLQIV